MSQRFEFLLDVCGLAPAAAPGGRRGPNLECSMVDSNVDESVPLCAAPVLSVTPTPQTESVTA